MAETPERAQKRKGTWSEATVLVVGVGAEGDGMRG